MVVNKMKKSIKKILSGFLILILFLSGIFEMSVPVYATTIESGTSTSAVSSDFYEQAQKTGYYVELDPTMSMEEAKSYVKDMDVLYTDTWVDMEFFNNPEYAEKKDKTLKMMMPYQINRELLEGSKAIVLHDMPMHVGYEISQEVVDENLEHILDQAENRRHAEKAVMATLLGKGEIL